MSQEVPASLSRLKPSHDGNGSNIDGSHRIGSTQGYAVLDEDTLRSDDAAEKQWRTKWKKKGFGFSLVRTVYKRKIEIFVVTVVALILVSEVGRLSLDRSSSTSNSQYGRSVEEADLNNSKIEDEKQSKLNNMDMTFKKGVACLELVSVEELNQLKLPSISTPSVVENLQYIERTAFDELPTASSFAGNQTLEERANSFKVQATMKVHCGFCDEGKEFKIDDIDTAYLAECKIVVVTCTFGGGDDLYQPIGMTDASLFQVCYVAFWDEVTLEVQAKKGQDPDLRTRHVGLWRVVVVQNLPFSDQRRNGKIPKLLGHRLFPQARYSIWVDSKSQFRRDPIGVIEALLVRPQSVFAISEHGGRSCVYKEGEAIIKKHKALPEEVSIQLAKYRQENFPENAQFDGHKALAEASIIVREHTPLTNLFMCNWFNEVMRFTARDQLSFPYVLVKLQEMHPRMFSVCTRRALVNSMGHTGKKPKPLDTKRS